MHTHTQIYAHMHTHMHILYIYYTCIYYTHNMHTHTYTQYTQHAYTHINTCIYNIHNTHTCIYTCVCVVYVVYACMCIYYIYAIYALIQHAYIHTDGLEIHTATYFYIDTTHTICMMRRSVNVSGVEDIWNYLSVSFDINCFGDIEHMSFCLLDLACLVTI